METRVVLITGASRGIGRAMAAHFARLGDHVVIGGMNLDKTREVVAEIRSKGGSAEALALDVRNENSVASFVGRARSLTGKLDVLINNAGVAGPVAHLHDVARSDWDDAMSINLTGAYLCCKHVLPAMIEAREGCIVNLSSVVGKKPFPKRAVYAAAKMGLIGLTRILATDYGEFGIRVNAVCPGAVAGERQEETLRRTAAATGRSVDAVRNEKLLETPLRCFIEPEKVADVVAFLCSGAASAMTGQDINICGGRCMN